jgi:hypothetical protein
LLKKRLEDLDYRIAQHRREGQEEQRLQRKRKHLLMAHAASADLLSDLTLVLQREEDKLEAGMGLFHRGLERLMIEDVVAIENLEVFKAAGKYSSVKARVQDIEGEVLEINSILERSRDRHDHLEMLQDWRADLYRRADREVREENAILQRRLATWLDVMEKEDDLRDLEAASELLELCLEHLVDALSSTTRVRNLTKRDLAVVASLQPPRTKHFNLIDALRHASNAYRTAHRLIDGLQGIEHLTVHVRDPERIFEELLEGLLLDQYEGGAPTHALRSLQDGHKYLLQIRDILKGRMLDVEWEVEDLQLREETLLLLAIDSRLRRRTPLNR